MRKTFFGLLFATLIAATASAAGWLPLGVIPSYSGPGNVVPGAVLDVSVRAYNAAYATGSNSAAILERASDSTTASINILTNGNFDAATANTFCATTTCGWDVGADQTGTGNTCNQATAANQPLRITNNSPFAGYTESFSLTGSLSLTCGDTGFSFTTFTYIAWIYPTQVTAFAAIIDSVSASATPLFRVTDSAHLDLVSSSVLDIGQSTGTIPVNTWTCVAVSYNSTTGAFAFYINGAASGSGTNIHIMNTSEPVIGFGGNAEPFLGNMAEALIYPSILSGANVASICNGTSP